MSSTTALPGRVLFFYAIGQLGWSTLINIVGLQLVYFYIPPQDAGIPIFITQATFLLVLNAITFIAASGRVFDAITDPIIANWSDNYQHPAGRRIPFLRYGAIPSAVFCVLMFVPIVQGESYWNIIWLVVMQLGFFLALTVYVTPFFALLPELGKTAAERLNLSTWISITYALGIILAAQTPVLAGAFKSAGFTPAGSLQLAFGIVAFFATLCMLVPAFTIDEHAYTQSAPPLNLPMMEALRRTFRNSYFRYYVVADFSYFMGLTIIQTGLLYYITVLLQLEESLVAALLALMVLSSFLFYPLVNFLAKKYNKKILVVGSFFWMSVVFLGIYFLGWFPLPNSTQAYLLILTYAVPIAFLGVLPNAILADIAGEDALASGEPQEGMYFAARTLLQKFGQTFGIFIFAALTTLGKDVGDDWGIRLSGLVGFVLCLAAGAVFTRYNEKQLLAKMAEHEAK